MSLVESLSRLREELPLSRRAAPKRVLLEHYLRREHACLQHLSAKVAVSANPPNPPKRYDPPFFQGPSQAACCRDTRINGSRSENRRHFRMPSRSKRVEDMFRKARLKLCFAYIMQHQRGEGKDVVPRRKPMVAPLPSSVPVLHSRNTENPGALGEEARNELDRGVPRQPSGSPRLALLHPGPARNVFEAPRSTARPAEQQPRASPDPVDYRDASQGEAERILVQRRRILRRFFHAARRRDTGGGGERLDLGSVGGPAAAGGAPCFTVGGSGRREAVEGHHRHGGVDHGDLIGPEGVGLRRADLLRRILYAMRESARERGTEADTSTAPPSPASLDRLPRPPALPTVPRRQLQSEQSSLSSGPWQAAPPPPPGGEVDLDASAARGELPVHPRREISIGTAHQAVFEALTRLLPPPTEEEARGSGGSGGGGGGGVAGAGVGTMRAAAIRCGLQCQAYISALQHGIEVMRLSAAGEDIRSTLTLHPATADGSTGAALALRDVDAPTEAVAAWASGGVVTIGHPSPAPSAPSRLPLESVTRVLCLTGSDGGESLRFAILAAAVTCFGRRGKEEEPFSPGTFDYSANQRGSAADRRVQSREGDQTAEGGEVEPFGVLRATSGEDFCALVLGVASVKSALDSPFRTRQPSSGGTLGQQRPPRAVPTGSAFSSSPTAAAAAAAAACLPWQGARVCIAELAPSLTLLGAVSAVEAEARRVGRDNGICLRDQNLLICTSAQR